MAPRPFAVVRRRRRGHGRHLDARARARRRRAARRRARPVHDALRLRRRRGADLDQRRPDRPAARSHTVARSARSRRAICAAQPGAVLGVRGPFGNTLAASSEARGRRRRRRRRRDRPRAAAPGASAHLLARRARVRRGSCCSTAAARRPTCSTGASSSAGGATGSTVEVTVDRAGAELARARRRRADADRAGAEFDADATRRHGLRARGDDALHRRGAARARRRRRAHLRLDGAQHAVRHRPLRPLPARPDARSAATARSTATTRSRALLRGAGAVSRGPQAHARRLEVRLLRRLPADAARLRGRAARARRRGRDRLLPRGLAARPCEGPYDLSLVEGSITTAARRRAHPARCAAARARSSRSAPAPPRAGSRRCATSPTSTSSLAIVYASPEYISTLATSTPISAHVAGRLRAARLPDRQAPAARGDHARILHGRRPRDRRRTASASSASGAAPSA